MAISLFGCTNKTDDSIVSEQEMYDALTLKGVEYLQLNIYDYDNLSLPVLRHEISPNRYHRINDDDDYFREYYLFQEGDTIKEWKTEKKGEPLKEVPYKDDFFATIDNIKEEFLGPIIGKKYENFEYHKDTKEYIVYFDDEYSGKSISAIKFSKKKVKEFTTWEESSDREHFFAKVELGYEEIIPIPPEQ